jgi:hypothetical protein
MFSERALRILEVHEAYVHVATTMNGRRQPLLTFLDKGPPSTTISQEGIAVLVEITAFTSHPTRLRRINDRIEAIHRSRTAPPSSTSTAGSWPSATPAPGRLRDTMRVFRGSLPDAGPFPKDLAYARGFVQAYNFLRVAIARGRVYRLLLLFTGKTALERIDLLFHAFDEGVLEPPATCRRTSPTWPGSRPGWRTPGSSTSSTSTASRTTTSGCCEPRSRWNADGRPLRAPVLVSGRSATRDRRSEGGAVPAGAGPRRVRVLDREARRLERLLPVDDRAAR